MDFYCSLSDSKSLHVSKTLLSILADLSNAVVWMVSIRPFMSKSSNFFINHLVNIPRAPITNGIIVTFTFNSFFHSFYKNSQVYDFARFFIYEYTEIY